jgi:MFS transporter, SHS family, lactate transporter
MNLIADLKSLEPSQRSAIWASYLGWTLDAFDFFLLVFVKVAIGKQFGVSDEAVSELLFLTLFARPFGAFFFGWLAERFGRRPILMIVILAFSAFSFLSGLAQTFAQLMLIRALFGFAMGGEWGIGASLVMESIPARLRGPVSGLLQSGYPTGYFLASLAYYLLFDSIGWRGMFFVGIIPALLVFLIRMHVSESPAHVALAAKPRANLLVEIGRNWKIALYLVVLMTAFNFFSHGTQDLYPTYLQGQRALPTHTVSLIVILANVGAIVGGILFGSLSQQLGRRRAMITAALLSLVMIPLWVFSTSVPLIAVGAFLMQLCVQGAWGVVPVHLNELSPESIRGTFPGLTYQLGNLLASANATLQAGFAERHGGNYALALATVGAAAALSIALLAFVGREAHGVEFGAAS